MDIDNNDDVNRSKVISYYNKLTNKSQLFILPYNEVKLQSHFSNFSDFIDDLSDYDDLIKEYIDVLLNISFTWHSKIVKLDHSLMVKEFRNAYMFSWMSFCRLYYLKFGLTENIDQINLRAIDFKFVKIISKTENIIITPKKIKDYSLYETRISIVLLLEILYKFPFTLYMKEYFNVIFFQYCSFLNEIKSDDDYDDFLLYKDGNDNETVTQNLSCETISSVIDNIVINDNGTTKTGLSGNYIFTIELIMKPQLFRFNVISQLEQLFNKYGDSNNNKNNLIVIANSFSNMLSEICHGILRKFIVEYFQNELGEVYLYPGDKENFKRKNPEMEDNAIEIIIEFRLSEYTHVSKILLLSFTEIIKIYNDNITKKLEILRKGSSSSSLENLTIDVYEKEILIISKKVNGSWFRSMKNKNTIFIEKNLLYEEIDKIESIDEKLSYLINRIHRKKVSSSSSSKKSHDEGQIDGPVLLRIMRIHYIIDIYIDKFGNKEIKIYKTFILPEAYCIWMALLIKRDIISLIDIHESLQQCISYIVKNILI